MKFAPNKKGIIVGIMFFAVFAAVIAIPVYLTVQETREYKSNKERLLNESDTLQAEENACATQE